MVIIVVYLGSMYGISIFIYVWSIFMVNVGNSIDNPCMEHLGHLVSNHHFRHPVYLVQDEKCYHFKVHLHSTQLPSHVQKRMSAPDRFFVPSLGTN